MKFYIPINYSELSILYDKNFIDIPVEFNRNLYFYKEHCIDEAIAYAKDSFNNDNSVENSISIVCINTDDNWISTINVEEKLDYYIVEQIEYSNLSVCGNVKVHSILFNSSFQGYDSKKYMLGNKPLIEQLPFLYKLKQYSTFDLLHEIQANKKMVYFNFPYWLKYNYDKKILSDLQKTEITNLIKMIWDEKFDSPKLIDKSMIL